jgi:CheY-like chemotaxis protein
MSKKALVIDNDFFFVEFLSEILEECGYEVMKAYDGKEGISKLEEGPGDIIFVDLVMPKIDGKQFIAFVRKKFPNHHFPLVAVSGTMIEQLDVLNEIGADYYIVKGPIEKMAEQIKEFMDTIERDPFPSSDRKTLIEPGRVWPRQTTVELMESVAFHSSIIENIGIGIVVIDKDARIIRANPRALTIVKKPLEDVLNIPITALFPSAEKATVINALKGVIHGEEIRNITLYAPIHSQECRITVSHFEMDGKIAGWILVMEGTNNG